MGKTFKGKVSPVKDHGQTKISSYFSSGTSSSLFSTIQNSNSKASSNQKHNKQENHLEKKTSADFLSSRKETVVTFYDKSNIALVKPGNISQNLADISDSDEEIIDSTPEAKINKRNILINVDDDASSPDIIPPTPQFRPVKMSCSLVLPPKSHPDIIPPTPDIKSYGMSCSLVLPPKVPVNQGSKSALSVLSAKSLNIMKGNSSKLHVLSSKSKLFLKPNKCSEISANDREVDELTVVAKENDPKKGSVQEPITQRNDTNSKSEYVCKPSHLSLKRHVKSGTGISPDPKRCHTPDKGNETLEISLCRTNLLGKFEQDTSVSEGENEGSFSLLHSNILNERKNVSENADNSSEDKPVQPEDDEWKDPTGVFSVSQEFCTDMIDEVSFKAPTQGSSLSEIVNNVKKHSGQLMSSHKGFTSLEAITSNKNLLSDQGTLTAEMELKDTNKVTTVSDECHIDTVDGNENNKVPIVKVSVPESEDMFGDYSGSLFNDELATSFEMMSPFKQQPQDVAEDTLSAAPQQPQLENKAVKKLLKESLGADSYASHGHYGRHVVVEVDRHSYRGATYLRLTCLHTKAARTCTLSGLWHQSAIMEGDIVHILFTEHENGHYTIDTTKGLIVINPDYLISGTSVVSGVFCRRKSILNERFRGLDTGNQLMLVGSLVHQLFQEVVNKKITSHDLLESLVRQLLAQPKMLRDMYGLGLSEDAIYEEMNNFIPYIYDWSKRYLEPGSYQAGPRKDERRNQWRGKILEIQDIEESIWSPKLGLKGKIDLTVKVQHEGKSKVVPLELKTGRSTFSAEHKGQVTLYSMMRADKKEASESGLLLYLRDGAMEEVRAGRNEHQGLILLRNEMIHFLSAKPVLIEGQKLMKAPSLPEPIDHERACSSCPHLLTCSAYQKSIEELQHDPSHTMSRLVPKITEHLAQSHLDYFRHWCLLLHLEIADFRNDSTLRALWCQDAIKRESSGDCLSSLVLEPSVDVKEIETAQFLHAFIRSPKHPNSVRLDAVGLQAGESIIVSTRREVAVSMGVISYFENNVAYVVLERNLRLYPKWQDKIYHVDRYEYQNMLGVNFLNIAKLLMNDQRAATLRSLIVDRNAPSFKKGLSQDVVLKGKDILKRLNKPQQRAVLRTLMANDYSLLKGFPGTGKTSTIVALVQLMVALGHSVLLTSYTHSAVDNILLKLKNQNVDFLRLGKTSRIHPDLISYAEERITSGFRDVRSLANFYDSKNVVATTCLGVNHVLFTKRTFDFCIMDEASQVLQVAALGPLFHASRFVLVGDSLQLPPVIRSSQASDLGMAESLFMRLDDLGATSCLTQQYRMNGHIMKLANMLMYDGQLQCANLELEKETVTLPYYENTAVKSVFPCWVRHVIDPCIDRSVVFVDTCGSALEVRDSASMIINTKEAMVVHILVKAFLKAGLNVDDLGVITPYRAQVKYLRSNITKEIPNGNRVEVNTVDQYQGRDKSVIIYSCVRSGVSQGMVSTHVGEILQDGRRLNVALTRAKHKLILIGDVSTLQGYTPFRKLTGFLESSQIYNLKDGHDGFTWHES